MSRLPKGSPRFLNGLLGGTSTSSVIFRTRGGQQLRTPRTTPTIRPSAMWLFIVKIAVTGIVVRPAYKLSTSAACHTQDSPGNPLAPLINASRRDVFGQMRYAIGGNKSAAVGHQRQEGHLLATSIRASSGRLLGPYERRAALGRYRSSTRDAVLYAASTTGGIGRLVFMASSWPSVSNEIMGASPTQQIVG